MLLPHISYLPYSSLEENKMDPSKLSNNSLAVPGQVKKKKSFTNSLRNLFSRKKSPRTPNASLSPEPPVPQAEAIKEKQVDPSPETVISARTDVQFKTDTIDPAKKIAMCEMGIQVIDLFQQAAKVTEVVLPSTVSELLEKLTGVLGVLKQMIENEQSWKELILTLDGHQQIFNDQLVRLKKDTAAPDPSSALLEPIRRYSRTLEELAASIIVDSGLVRAADPEISGWQKLKTFTSQYWKAGSEQEKMKEYKKQLSDAIQDLMMSLAIYTGFTVQDIMSGVVGLAHQLEAMDMKNTKQSTVVHIVKVTAKTLPVVSPYYVKREREWELMCQHLVHSTDDGQKIFPITGMGGSGKTQMVSYFLRENPSLYTHVVVVDASSELSIKNDLERWARSLGDIHHEDTWEDGLNILASGSYEGHWILIFDNADDITLDLPPFLPKCSDGTVIITSRNRDVGNLATTYHLEIGQMEKDEALDVILKAARRQSPISPEEQKSAQDLMEELGYLAVALVQVGTYCHQLSSTVKGVLQPYSFTKYLSLFHAQRAKLMKRVGPSSLDNYKPGAYTAFDISYEAMSPEAKEFLHFISYFYRTDISMMMFEAAAENSFKEDLFYLPRTSDHQEVVSGLERLLCADGTWDQLLVQESVQTLRSFSLISTTIIDDALFIQIHPLVQAWTRDMPVPNSQHYKRMAQLVITLCGRDRSIQLSRYLLPHLRSMVTSGSPSSWHVNDQVAGGKILDHLACYSEAQGLFLVALQTVRGIVGEDNEAFLAISGLLARSYTHQGDFDNAERLTLEVLEKGRNVLGETHLLVIVNSSNLAIIYSWKGRLDEAEALEEEALEYWKARYGMEYQSTILAASNLAVTYSAKGKLEEAERLQVEVLELRNRTLGPDDLNTIQAAQNLAATYRERGRLLEAENMCVQALDQLRRILGKEHPSTLTAAANLAVQYTQQTRWKEAESLATETLELQKSILPPDHPQTISSMVTMGVIYGGQKRYEEARQMEEYVVEWQRRKFGDEHPDTLQSAGNLASTYGWLGRLEEEEKLELDILEKKTRILGKEHPNTLVTAGNLAVTYQFQGRLEEAEKLGREIWETRKRVLGEDHVHTIGSAESLVGTYEAQERFEEAIKLELEVVAQRKKLMGPEHPMTVTSAEGLARLYCSVKVWGEAERISLEMLEIRRKEDPDTELEFTIRAVVNLALAYRFQDRWEETEPLLALAVERGVKVIGVEYPHVQNWIKGLAKVYRALGKEKEALETETLLPM